MYWAWKGIRWLVGYADVEIRGVYGERLLSLCVEEDLDLWEIRRVCPGILRVKVFLFSLGRVEVLARKCGAVATPLVQTGLPRTLRRYRRRPGLFFGALLYLFLMLILPCFVWSVEIPDADPIRAARIRCVLLEEGFGTCSFIPSVDFRDLKYRLMLADDEISFVSVNMKGSRAVVEVRFMESAPQMEEDTPCNLVASRDGQILSVLVKNGVRYVQKGQTVQKGDLLVGGIVDTRLGYYFVRSDAEILARVTDTVSETVSLTKTETTRTGRMKKQRFWNFFGAEVNGSPGFTCPYEQYETVTVKKHLSFGENCTVPITLTEVCYYETVTSERKITPEEAEFFARRRLEESDRLRLNGVVVESMKETVSRSAEGVTVTRVRSLIADICERKEFYFENEGY